MDTENSHIAIIKNIISLLVFVSVIFLVHYATTTKESIDAINEEIVVKEEELYHTCFMKREFLETGSQEAKAFDLYTLVYKEVEGGVEGELVFLPWEKDSKTGTFKGSVFYDEVLGGSRFSGLWNTYAEGMEATEELAFYHDDNNAYILLGEMVEAENGVYVYKDKEGGEYSLTIPRIDCSLFYEIKDVKDYFASNISTLAGHEPVLGGTFYITSVVVNEVEDTVEVSYEDGHLAHTETFNYNYQGRAVSNITSIKNEQ